MAWVFSKPNTNDVIENSNLIKLGLFTTKHKNAHLPENKPKLDEKVKIPEPEPQHFFCQTWKTLFENYFEHIYSIDHRNAWKLMQNLSYFNKLDTILEEISEDHFSELKSKRATLKEEKENIECNQLIFSNPAKNLMPFKSNIKNSEETISQLRKSYATNNF